METRLAGKLRTVSGDSGNGKLPTVSGDSGNTLAHIFKSRITLVHPHSRSKSDFTDLIFSCYVLEASYTEYCEEQ